MEDTSLERPNQLKQIGAIYLHVPTEASVMEKRKTSFVYP